MKNEKQKKTKIKKERVLIRHRLLFKQISENVRNGMSMEEAMKAVGYSGNYAKTSTRLLETDSWNELMKEKLPDTLLMNVHLEGLSAAKKVFKNNNDSGEIEMVSEEPDYPTRHKYLDTGYKIKRKYDNTIKITGKLDGISDEEIEGRIAGILSGVIGLVAREGKKGK